MELLGLLVPALALVRRLPGYGLCLTQCVRVLPPSAFPRCLAAPRLYIIYLHILTEQEVRLLKGQLAISLSF